MGDVFAVLKAIMRFSLALALLLVLVLPSGWANPPIDLPGRGLGLGNGQGGGNGQGNGNAFGLGNGNGKGAPAGLIKNGISPAALTNWQSMPAGIPVQAPGIIRMEQVPAVDDGSKTEDRVRVDVGGSHALEMMSDKVMNGSKEFLYSQVINQGGVTRQNTIGRDSDGNLRIYGYTDSQVESIRQGNSVDGERGITFEGGHLEVMDDVYQSGLK